jgi:transcriptional regulator with XRE-family HTH domain
MDVGSRLRTAREARGLSLETLARATRVQARFLSAIEHNDIRGVPPRPYGRAFVRAYAAHVGLDPDDTVREFFAAFAPPPPPQPVDSGRSASLRLHVPPIDARWRTAAMVVLTVVAAAVLVIGIGRRVFDGGPDAQPSPTTGRSAPPVASTIGRNPVPAAARTTSAPRGTGVSVVLEATRPAWVSASVDGRRVLYRTMKAGERQELSGSDAVRVRVGDAGAVRWQVNGRPAETMGRPGQVRTAVVAAGPGAAGG